MTKLEFKAVMSAFRSSLKKAVWSGREAYNAVLDSDASAASCLRPRYNQVVSRRVCNYLYKKGGLNAVRHIDSVEIHYN